jgi:hypothetical protein
MKYIFEGWSISKLIDLYEKDKLCLNPPYQRNDIWSLPAKRRLIDTIISGFPLPSFFLFLNAEGVYEMVDGQQRTRTFLGYKAGLFSDSEKVFFSNCNQDFYLNEYQLVIIIISDVLDYKSIIDFYFKVNKFGSKLNRPEILRSEHFDNPVQTMIEEVSESAEFLDLELFTEGDKTRLIDQDFIGELFALTHYGITDKKVYTDNLFKELENNNDELGNLKQRFIRILDRIINLNQFFPLKETRYRQRNDFYTLFSFIRDHFGLDDKYLMSMYEILIKIDTHISPSNDKCFPLQNYAFNCVTQSNSKKSREARLEFFKTLLLNQSCDFVLNEKGEPATDFHEIMIYFGIENNNLNKIGDYYLLPIDRILPYGIQV